MPDEDRISISALSTPLSLDASDVIPVVQGMGGSPVTMGATVGQLAAKTAEDTTLSNLETTAKKVVPAINELNSRLSMQEITSQITFNETITGTNTHFYVKNNVLYIFYQGENKSHSAGDTVFTIPSAYKPSVTLYIPYTINAVGYGTLEYNYENGVVKINNVSSTSVSGRIYFTCAIPLG